MISSEQAYKLIAYGVPKIDRINELVNAAISREELNDRQLAVVVICYAASLARLTRLNLHDFLGLSGAAYQNVEISKKDPTETETDPGIERPSGG